MRLGSGVVNRKTTTYSEVELGHSQYLLYDVACGKLWNLLKIKRLEALYEARGGVFTPPQHGQMFW
jgi:hypothetical protein